MSRFYRPFWRKGVSGVAAAPFLAGYFREEQSRMFRALHRDGSRIVQE
jgi:hypothetical protein